MNDMQATWSFEIIGWILLIIGLALVLIALLSATHHTNNEQPQRMKSKGVILIGPIPIVWGFGSKGWLVAGFLIVFVVIIWLISLT